MTFDPNEAAKWMIAEIERDGDLLQADAADYFETQYDDEAVYENSNGNLAIKKSVLDAFWKLTGDDVVWVRSEKFWRKREPGDEPGRLQ